MNNIRDDIATSAWYKIWDYGITALSANPSISNEIGLILDINVINKIETDIIHHNYTNIQKKRKIYKNFLIFRYIY